MFKQRLKAWSIEACRCMRPRHSIWHARTKAALILQNYVVPPICSHALAPNAAYKHGFVLCARVLSDVDDLRDLEI